MESEYEYFNNPRFEPTDKGQGVAPCETIAGIDRERQAHAVVSPDITGKFRKFLVSSSKRREKLKKRILFAALILILAFSLIGGAVGLSMLVDEAAPSGGMSLVAGTAPENEALAPVMAVVVAPDSVLAAGLPTSAAVLNASVALPASRSLDASTWFAFGLSLSIIAACIVVTLFYKRIRRLLSASFEGPGTGVLNCPL